MFRVGRLREALQQAHARGIEVTDEAMAIELAGGHPRLVPGHPDNIKITLPGDLALAELFLKQQASDP
jgi:2-C-methyl-D-erythritol 4-phosphate cytidylyltransferase